MTDDVCKGKVGLSRFAITKPGTTAMSEVEQKTISVPEAGRRYFDLGKNASYEAARRGDIPAIRIGGRLRVPVVAMERILVNSLAILTP